MSAVPNRRKWIAAGLGAALVGYAWIGWRRWSEAAFVAKYTPRALELFGGAEGADVLRRPDSVKVWRIKHKRIEPWLHREELDDVVPNSPLVDVPPEVAASLAETLLSPYTYDWAPIPTNCHIDYGVQSSFVRGERRRDVLFCFQCETLVIFSEPGGRHRDWGRFSFGAPQLARNLKRLFPADPEIQGLSTELASHKAWQAASRW